MGKKQYSFNEMETMYKDVVSHVSKLMIDNQNEWEPRYKGYLDILVPDSKASRRIIRLKNMYQIESPLTRYLSVSYAQKAKSRVVFDLRVYGHSIGNLIIKVNKDIAEILDSEEFYNSKHEKLKELTRKEGISTFVINKTNYRALEMIANELLDSKRDIESEELKEWLKKYTVDKKGSFEWNSSEMSSLRSILQRASSKFAIISEHSCENLLLKLLSMEKGSDKPLINIQPIKIGESGFFQMPTCLKGSDAKKSYKNIEYAKQNGGGIDILARIKRGTKSEICVIELKDEYLHSERPVLALKQAIAYAVCLDYIMRSENVNEVHSWYDDIFMPNSKKKIDDSIRINVVAAMPYMEGAMNEKDISEEDKAFVGKEIEINVLGHKDVLVLHYMFFKKKTLTQKGIEDGLVTSLPLKHNF